MRYDSYLSKLEDLQNWFEINNAGKLSRPYFTVYRGLEAKQDRVIYRNEEISEPEKAWEMLEEIIRAHSEGGGTFRILIVHEPKHNVGVSTIVKIPNPNPMQAAIHGAGVQQGNFGIYGTFREALETELARERKIMEMEHELEALKEGQAALNGVETFRQLVADIPALNGLIHALGMKIMGMGPTNTPQPQPQPQNYQGTPAADNAVNGSYAEGFDYEVIDPALDKLRTVFPDVESTMDRFAEWVKQNPDMAKAMFDKLPSS